MYQLEKLTLPMLSVAEFTSNQTEDNIPLYSKTIETIPVTCNVKVHLPQKVEKSNILQLSRKV